MPRWMRLVSRVFSALLLIAGTGFLYLFHEAYWIHRHDFNAQGRYFDPEACVVYHAQSAFLILPSMLLFAGGLALGFLPRWLKRRLPQPAM